MAVPTYTISGFLGSGKTTVLLKMIEECEKNHRRVGVILNELGDVNIEKPLFKEQNVKELLNGCICCTIKEDLKSTLDEFIKEMHSNKLDLLFIEGTGVSNPLEVKRVLEDPIYAAHFDLISMISLIDSSTFLEYQSIFSSTADMRKLLEEQITSANIILLNKQDLAKEKVLNKSIKKIKGLVGESVPIFQTSHGNVPLSELFKRRNGHLPTSIHSDIREETNHSHHHHHSGLHAVKIDPGPTVMKHNLEDWLSHLPKAVLRGKGVVNLEGSEGLYSFQLASNTLIFEEIPDPAGMRPAIILIGDQLKETELLNSFNRIVKA
ncbi:CobW family GTP-binding protein [Halobacillus kuroshimensis]|uniref:CobW family GTP-binding protein n=1 Tax=Halobacillus kuroshimensis TaxID=302481 RepID=UPI00041D9759|nr:GTP-binding protein [Halobacillus kuroshimensis]